MIVEGLKGAAGGWFAISESWRAAYKHTVDAHTALTFNYAVTLSICGLPRQRAYNHVLHHHAAVCQSAAS